MASDCQQPADCMSRAHMPEPSILEAHARSLAAVHRVSRPAGFPLAAAAARSTGWRRSSPTCTSGWRPRTAPPSGRRAARCAPRGQRWQRRKALGAVWGWAGAPGGAVGCAAARLISRPLAPGAVGWRLPLLLTPAPAPDLLPLFPLPPPPCPCPFPLPPQIFP